MDAWTNPAARNWRGGRRVDHTAFHAKLPYYRPTPVHPVPDVADALGLGAVLVKDESRRFGLPAFKILGASWGVYRALCDRMAVQPPWGEGERQRAGGRGSSWRQVAELRQAFGSHQLRLVTASAGNHGHAVARMGRWLRIPTLVLLPAGTHPTVVSAIAAEGAEVRHVDGAYDDAVIAAADLAAQDDRHVLVQDTAWDGYEQVPGWIVEGYHTLFRELDDQLARAGSHADAVVVPVGVGSLMSAAIQYYRAPVPPWPALLGVEPVAAACALTSLHAGRPLQVDTSVTAMAGLNAGTVSSLAWPLLRDGLDAAIAVDDPAAERARAVLAARDIAIGACGSATLAGLSAAMSQPSLAEVREALGLTATSTVVLVATDGPPDPARSNSTHARDATT